MPKTIHQTYKLLSEKTSDLEARIILKERSDVSWADIITRPDDLIDDNAMALIERDLEQFQSGKPLSRIYGKREFWGLEFSIDEHTLDPRADSETLIEVALAHYKNKPAPKTILDLGTGSGCLLLALLSEFKSAKGIGVDISEGAVKAAQNNAKALGLDGRAEFIKGKWGESLNESFDLIISNPPYIASKVIPNLEKNVKNHDPMGALDGGNDGLDAYNEIFSDLFRLMNDDGLAVFEIGFDQADDITRLSNKYEIRIGTIHADLSGNPRAVDMFKK
ncbi:MAG: peptide chain release factor N(5)-glutamine methyltransferase [Alphaproteobacteria bacterium]|nr:peptide chain release factor N(5)-glutamine methyltransferase [Alphaproteobacteria bacterium]